MTKKTIEEQLDDIWKSSGKGGIKYWTAEDAASHLEMLSNIQRTMILVGQNIELALLSKNESIVKLARHIAIKKLSSEERKQLEVVEQTIQEIHPRDQWRAYPSLTRLIEDSDRVIETIDLITSSPGEALTSPNTYIRGLAKATFRSKEIKKVKSKLRRTRNSWQPRKGRSR